MHPNPRRIIPVLLILALAAAAYAYFRVRTAAAGPGPLTASGTIEAVTVNISPELGGRIVSINAAEGAQVQAGDVLVQLDTRLLEAQRAQAEAGLAAAQAAQTAAEAARAAAEANYALLQAGPSAEQLRVAQTVVDRARVGLDSAQSAYDALPEPARDTADGRALKAQVDAAEAGLANAQAQYDLAAAGARPEQLEAASNQAAAAAAQAEAAAAQVRSAQAALGVLDVQIGKMSIVAPVDGVVLAQAAQPGEVVSPGAILLSLGQLDWLTITVYVPEDRYGTVQLGQTADITVDSFPGERFTGPVTNIADQAEFTPRNVQTASGRKSTVYAVKLTIANPGHKLKPGMPADVVFGR